VQVGYRCWADKILSVKKGPDEMEKFRDLLWQSNIEHKSEQVRNDRKVITHEVFKVACDFRVQGKLEGDHESGKVKIVTKNVGGFDVDLFSLLALEMNDHAVEEFAKYFIGRPNKWEEVVKRSSINQRSPAQTPLRAQRAQPQYLVHEEATAAASEEKRSLLGSIKSVLNKELF
jgi:hypothetical protein